MYAQDSLLFNKKHLNITNDAKNRAFKIRFVATGSKCNTGVVWSIDNIHVYRTCASPENLTGDYYWNDTLPGEEEFGVKVCWDAPAGVASFNNTSNRSFQSFNLYRKADNENGYTLYANIPYIPDSTHYCFLDMYPAVSMQQGYYYKVTALWEDVESCESESAHALQIQTDDFVYVYVTKTDNHVANSEIKVYPNPTVRKITIESQIPVKKITVFNMQGKTVLEKISQSGKIVLLNVSTLSPGVYLFKITTAEKTIPERVVVR